MTTKNFSIYIYIHKNVLKTSQTSLKDQNPCLKKIHIMFTEHSKGKQWNSYNDLNMQLSDTKKVVCGNDERKMSAKQ